MKTALILSTLLVGAQSFGKTSSWTVVKAMFDILGKKIPFSSTNPHTHPSCCPFFPCFSTVPIARIQQHQSTSALAAAVPDEDLSPEARQIREIQAKWSEIRHYDRATADAKLEGEWLEAYNRYYQQYHDDMKRMEEIVQNLKGYWDPPRIQKKSKGQKRRDALARKMA
jgi:hypothetical protein